MTDFPIGYRSFHPDPSLNYELNRWRAALPEEEIESLAPRIGSLGDWSGVMVEHAETAEREGRALNAAFYWRAAEFFMAPDDPSKGLAYDRFRSLFESSVRGAAHVRREVPFEGSSLPAIVLEPAVEEKETVLLHGGFDSFMEELFDWATVLRDAGYRVVLFEGPGQGAALRKRGLVMGPDWEKPVAAVLDHLRIERCTIFGVSLGGYLAPRAAAFERRRIRRVIVCDVLDDFYDCFAARSGRGVASLLDVLVRLRFRGLLNALVGRAMSRDPSSRWALLHGMQVSGARDPFDFVRWLKALRTAPFSERVTQDVLLLAGADDHIVPRRQLYRQMRSLPNVRSLTCRLFTASEEASSHCQIGNVGLMLGVVVGWLDLQIEAEERGLTPAALPRVA